MGPLADEDTHRMITSKTQVDKRLVADLGEEYVRRTFAKAYADAHNSLLNEWHETREAP